MPWNKTCPMRERVLFVADVERGADFCRTCQTYGISRKTGYKWLRRFREEAVEGLIERSRRPHHSPTRTADEIRARLIEARHRRPYWGPKKLKASLERETALLLPSQSTIGEILRQSGLTKPRRRARKVAGGGPCSQAQSPNDVWCADFKGQFRVGDGQLCYPLTVTDEHSRFLLACQGLISTKGEGAKAVFERIFKEHGLPRALKTDNGSPFASHGAGGLSKLAVWCLKLGIRPLRIAKGKPQQNGRHERMHGTLKRQTALPPQATMEKQQQSFDAFVKEYNEDRPHEGLGQRLPNELYKASDREYPKRVEEPQYPSHWEVRRVSRIGMLKLRGYQAFVSTALGGEVVGLEEYEDGRWRIEFAGHPVAIFDLRQGVVELLGCSGAPIRVREYNTRKSVTHVLG